MSECKSHVPEEASDWQNFMTAGLIALSVSIKFRNACQFISKCFQLLCIQFLELFITNFQVKNVEFTTLTVAYLLFHVTFTF